MHECVDVEYEGYIYVVYTTKYILDKKTHGIWQVSKTKIDYIK